MVMLKKKECGTKMTIAGTHGNILLQTWPTGCSKT